MVSIIVSKRTMKQYKHASWTGRGKQGRKPIPGR